MPLKIEKRRNSPYWQITGTYGGVRVRESTGTSDKRIAEKLRIKRETEIDAGKIERSKTVSDAILAYIQKGGENRFLLRINAVMGTIPLDEVDQAKIDQAVRDAYPPYKRGKKGQFRTHKSSTLRRQFYTPLLSVLHYAHDLKWMGYIRIKMPKPIRPAPQWGDPEWFKKFYEFAEEDLADLVEFLSTTGCRISEALNLHGRDILHDDKSVYVRTTKNGEPREVHLPESVYDIIKDTAKDAKCFKYDNTTQVNYRLKKTAKLAKIKILTSHKVGSHSFATNLYKYAGMDARALTETGRWKDPKSTYHYVHSLKREEAKKSEILTQKLTQRTKQLNVSDT